MTNVSNLPRPNREPPEHITVPIDEFAEKLGQLLADGEDKAARGVLLALCIADDLKADIHETNEATNQVRARLYAAQLKVLMKGIGG